MSTERTISKGIRLKREVAEYFKDKPLNRYVESMYESIQRGEIKEEENGISVHSTDKRGANSGEKTSTDSVHTDLDELLSYASIFRMSQEGYVREIKAAIDNGVLMEEDGHFVGVGKYDLSSLEEKCKKNGIEVQSVINKMEKMIG